MFVTKKMIRNLLTGFSPLFKKGRLIPALLLAVPMISAAQHQLLRSVYLPINPDNTHEIDRNCTGLKASCVKELNQ